MNYQSPDPVVAESQRSPADQAKEQVHEVARRAQGAVGEVQVKFREQVDERSTQLGEQVAATAVALRSGADELHGQGNASVADAAQRAAVHAERLGSYLQSSDANRILADAEEMARRNPWLVVAGGVVAGAAAARFLKASSSRRYERSRCDASPSAWPNGGAP